MTKQEFEKIAKTTVTQKEYAIIEIVYNWYPTLSNVNGKEQIATIYNAGGISVIDDMLEKAKKAMNIDLEIQKHKIEISRLEQQMKDLSNVL